MAHESLTAVGTLMLSLCFSATALVTARSRATRRSVVGGEFSHTYDEEEDWETSANAHQYDGVRWFSWESNSRFGSLEIFGDEGKSVDVGAIQFRVDEPEGRRYIVSVGGSFNATGVAPADTDDNTAQDWPFYPRSDLAQVWHALRAGLIRNLQIPPGEEERLESEPRAHELGVENEQGDATLFTFHENRTAVARSRVRKVVDRLDMREPKRQIYRPDGYKTQRQYHDAIQARWINGRVPKRGRE